MKNGGFENFIVTSRVEIDNYILPWRLSQQISYVLLGTFSTFCNVSILYMQLEQILCNPVNFISSNV